MCYLKNPCHLKKPSRGGLILGYGGTNAQEIQDGVKTLKASLAR
jgi:hypothetical protein